MGEHDIAELIELLRYAELERKDFDLSDEFSAAVYSTWYLLDPMSVRGSGAIGSFTPYDKALSREQKKKAIRFTAHSHTNEPQIPSPDDQLIYSAMDSTAPETVHFITDRFSCKKIK